MPSAMLEHEAHMFGFRERAPPPRAIGSPQQMQIDGFNIGKVTHFDEEGNPEPEKPMRLEFTPCPDLHARSIRRASG